MMTARQYASKYAGETVKLAAKHVKGLGLGVNENDPIGIVVGFKIGKIGQIGSSKVAVWRDKYEFKMALNPKTDTKYNPVVDNAPKFSSGIYFLSVDYLELLNPSKVKKPVVVYPDRCKCGAPCRKGNSLTICSNSKCKTRAITFKAIGPFSKIKVLSKEGYVLCPVCQTNDLEFQNSYGSQSKLLMCRAAGHCFSHAWKEGQKMVHKGIRHYIWKNGALNNLKV